MAFPNQNFFSNPFLGQQNSSDMQPGLSNPSAALSWLHSTVAPSMSSGSFGTPSVVSSSLGKWPGTGFPSHSFSFPSSSETGSRFVTTKMESGPGSSEVSSGFTSTSGLFGLGQTPARSTAIPDIFQASGNSSGTSSSSFGGQATGNNLFSSNNSFGGFNIFGNVPKLESNEPSRPTLFGKVISTESERHDAESLNEASKALKPPDLMSLSPRNVVSGGGAKLFGKALTSVDEAPPRGRSAERRESPSKERSSRPMSLMRVVLNRESDKDSQIAENKNLSVSDLDSGDGNESYDQKDVKREPALRMRRLMSDVDRRVLVVKGIPLRFNNQARLRSHFMNFGDVEKILINSRANVATVFFSDHESAERAKEHGRFLSGVEKPLLLFWRVEPKQRVARQGSVSESKEAKTRTSSDEISGHRKRMNEIDEELASMQGSQDVQSDVGAGVIGQQVAAVAPVLPEMSSPVARHSFAAAPSVVSSKGAESFPQTASSRTVEADFGVTVRSLAGSVGRTAAEKLSILEKRDALLKAALGNQKQANLATAKAIKGTCQDMCPERERYTREVQRRLSPYEIIPDYDQQVGKVPPVDHARAVKEYSRSSADQDMPLPQELRPPEVLDRTMNYLLSRVIDTGGAGKWTEWYDFLWNRTRGIRKDITQQHLCDPVAVSLVEKCARFHIYCSEALCEEDVAIFDPKINNENLTKCLQTLKELYHDLHVRQNVACLENEGEFVMYMVLMNLNKGDILREVQQLNPVVRESEYVNFSIRVYSALNSTNYVKFFKLVRVAPFLGACILHRYFNQIRTSAFQRMIKAYAQPGHGTAYPISELMRQLGFETKEEVENFGRHHGLSVENGQVILDKNRFSDSEAFPVCRSLDLVEGKQRCRLGEVINGGPLPPCNIRDPSSSFDDNGQFICGDDGSSVADVKSFDAKVVPPNTASVFVAPGSDHVLQPVIPVSPAIPNEVVKNVARELILDLLNSMCLEIAQTQMNSVQYLLHISSSLVEDLVVETCVGMIRNECQTTFAECAKEQEDQRRARLSAMVLEACASVSSDILDDTVMGIMRSVAFEEHRAIKEMTHKRAMDAVTETLIEQLLLEVCTSDGDWICHDVFMTDVTKKLEALNSSRKAVERLHLGRVFRKWKAQFSAHQRLRQAMENFPPAPSMETWPVQFSYLVPGSDGVVENGLHLGGSVSVTLKSPQEIRLEREQLSKDIVLSKVVSKWQHDVLWLPFDLCQMIINLQFLQKFPPASKGSNMGFYWKLVVAFPEVNESMEEEIKMFKWLKAKFSDGKTPVSNDSNSVAVLNLSSVDLVERNSCSSFASLNVCVVSVTNNNMPNVWNAKKNLLGSSGILFIVRQNLNNAPHLWKEERKRLEDMLASRPPQPKIPLAVVCCSSCSYPATDVVDGLDLQQKKCSDRISDFKVFSLDLNIENPQTLDKLEVVVKWIMSNCPKPLHLAGSYIRDFVENGLSCHFFAPVLENLAVRRKKDLLQLNVNKLISMYNGVIEWLSLLASSSELTRLSWPVIEFCSDHEDLPDPSWNSKDQLDLLNDLICRLALPEFTHSHEEHGNWSEACADVWNYVDAIIEVDKTCSRFLNRIEALLSKAENQFKLLCRTSPWSSLDNCPLPLYANLPWMDLVMICVEYRINCVLAADRETENMKVYFSPETIEPCTNLSLSLEADLEKSSADEVKLLDTVITAVKRKRMSVKDDSHLPFRKKFSFNLSSDLERSENNEKLSEQQESLESLKSALTSEKKQSAEFEEFLKKSLDLETVPEASFYDKCYDDLKERTSGFKCRLFPNPALASRVADRDESFKVSSSVDDKMMDLSMLIKSERTADRLFEIYLENSILNDSK